jgi:hypothetical protein
MTILLVLFIALQIGDFYTTYKIIKSGVGHEANPILAKLFAKIGYVWGLSLAKGFAVVIGLGIAYLSNNLYPMAILVLFYVWVIYNNIKVLKCN